MVEKDYKKISQDLISGLGKREREVLIRRYGLFGKKSETLQSIGDSFGVTRERVRQIQSFAEKKAKEKIEKYKVIFKKINDYLKKNGGLKREEILLEDLGGSEKNELLFILELGGKFLKTKQDENFYNFWALNEEIVKKSKELIKFICRALEKEKKLMEFEKLKALAKTNREFLISCLEISKKIKKNEKGLYGLKEWPEISPRGVRDKAYLIFKELGKPLHFTEVASLIKNANVATVHNELIRDERFILVGRGIYALKEWGYFPGEVKEVIFKILKEKGKPMTKEEIIEEVRKQRIVRENTILINLANKNYFERDEKGRYKIKTDLI